MKMEVQVRKQLEELKKQTSSSANMNYERGGAIEALEWVLESRENLSVGSRL